MGFTKTLGRGVFNPGPLDLKPWLVKHGSMVFQGHLLGSSGKKKPKKCTEFDDLGAVPLILKSMLM